jgi:hypothetical protein
MAYSHTLKLHNDKINNLYSSPITVLVIVVNKSAGHARCKKERKRKAWLFLVGRSEQKHHSEELGAEGIII